jgi:hypothetical protein
LLEVHSYGFAAPQQTGLECWLSTKGCPQGMDFSYQQSPTVLVLLLQFYPFLLPLWCVPGALLLLTLRLLKLNNCSAASLEGEEDNA